MGRSTINITFSDFHHEVMETDGVKIDENGDLMLYDLVPINLAAGEDVRRMRADRIYHESDWIEFTIQRHT